MQYVRRKATVVYVGSVKEVRLLTRTKFDIKARAVVDVLAVMRGPGMNPREAAIEHSSFDDKTPMLESGPQYQATAWPQGCGLCKLLRKHHSSRVSLAGQPRSCCNMSWHSAMPYSPHLG